MFTVGSSRFPVGTFVRLRSVICFIRRLSKSEVSFRTLVSMNLALAL
jgi:hypothetical protein